METPPASRPRSLDQLAASAAAGDAVHEERLLADLRVRFLQVAKRRVRPEALEDVVHEALRIVLERYRERRDEVPILVWSLTVLRNVIGNHYQSRRRERLRHREVGDWQRLPVPDAAADPLDELADRELHEHLQRALAALARRHPRCARLFHCLLESLRQGGGVQEVTGRTLELVRREEPDLTRNTFYVTLHRCRARLRALLASERGEELA